MCTCFCLWIGNTKLWKLRTYLCFVSEVSLKRNKFALYCAVQNVCGMSLEVEKLQTSSPKEILHCVYFEQKFVTSQNLRNIWNTTP
jgi:hypothetical protein